MKVMVAAALAVLVSLACTGPVFACYWDRDTLAMEKRSLPGSLKLMTGQFLRHSSAYYKWRVTDRTKRLSTRADHLPWLDDLAVAHDKLGEHEEAIAVAKKALALDSKRYESHANLGTIYIHAGRFQDGLKHIEEAIAINPEAHFGREVFQKLLVEYVIAVKGAKADVLVLPLSWKSTPSRLEKHLVRIEQDMDVLEKKKKPFAHGPSLPARGFARFITVRGYTVDAALRGVRGMLRFGQWDSPILLEVMGDLLAYHDTRSYLARRRLSARAYLLAAKGITDDSARLRYRALAFASIEGQTKVTLQGIEKALEREMKRGRRWWGAVERNEKRWVSAGADMDKRFDRAYYRRLLSELATLDSVAQVKTCDRHALGERATKQSLSVPLGLTPGEVLDRLGTPMCVSRRRWRYTLKDEEQAEIVTVSFRRGKTHRVVGIRPPQVTP